MAWAAVAGEANAEEAHLVDYDPLEAVSATWDYRLLDDSDQVSGDLSVEIAEEEPDGFFRHEIESNLGDSVGTATFRQRFNDAGERVVASIDFGMHSGGMSFFTSIEYDEPTANFASLSLGEEKTTITTFTEEAEGFDGQPITRTGTMESTIRFEAFEEVTVPAGTFDTIRLRITDSKIYDDAPGDPDVVEERAWHAKGIGRVMREFLDKEPDEPHHKDVLVAYSLPGDPGESFVTWAAGYNLAEGEDGPDANPSGDGLSNLMKFALGLDPRKAVRDQLPKAEFEEVEGDRHLAMDIPLNGTADNVTVVVEVSSDMENWESGSEHVTVIDKTDTFLRVRDNSPASDTEKRFARLRVEFE